MNIFSIEYFSHLVNPNITSTIARSSAPHGRGGSVSRRDHTQASRRPHLLSGGTNYAEIYPAKRQPLFERGGLWKRRFSQRSGLSPQNLPIPSTLIQSPLYDADDLRKKITDNRKISAGKPLKDKNKDCTKDRETDRHAQSTR